MVSMMQSRGKLRTLVDILADPKQLDTQIQAFDRAAEAHAQAAEKFLQRKADALVVLDELDKKQSLHNARQAELDKFHIDNTNWAKDLAQREAQLTQNKTNHENDKNTFEKYKKDTLKDLSDRTTKIVTKETQLNLLKNELDKKLAYIENDIKVREESIKNKELFLHNIVNRLKA